MKRLIILILVAFSLQAYDAKSTCVKCHSDRELLKKLGAPQMYMDPAKVDEEVNMAGEPTCVDCHLGNNRTMDMEKAHRGLLKPFYAAIGKHHKYQYIDRSVTNYDRILPKGKKRFAVLMRKPTNEAKKKYGIKKLLQLHYHDRDTATFAFNIKIAEKTCGKCHEEEVNDYKHTSMALSMYQRAFQDWTKSPPGPQNCGVWFADNYETIKGECTRNYTREMANSATRGCNKCHTSCLDCHYAGYKKSATSHKFLEKPEAMSCYGGGRGTICHAGPMDRRRGAGYMRQEFAFPAGELPDDVHNKNGVTCLDCHTQHNHDFGHLASADARKSCSKCHNEIVQAVSTSRHKNVDCSSCHVQKVGAYQFTFWGPGLYTGMFNVFTKHKQYYGVRSEPLLVKHPSRGVWIPVKPYPMAVLNISKDVKPTGLMVRSIPHTKVKGHPEIGEPEEFVVERTPDKINDLYIITGTFDGLKYNNKMLAWIQMDKMSHALGKGRNCESCHNSHDQISTTWYTYLNMKDVKKPFSGSYIVKATKDGITFTGFENHTPIIPRDGRKIEDFAPFLSVPEAWNVRGIDFSIPFDETEYERELNLYNMVYAEIHQLRMKYKKLKDQAMLEELRKIRAILPHNPELASTMIKELASSR